MCLGLIETDDGTGGCESFARIEGGGIRLGSITTEAPVGLVSGDCADMFALGASGRGATSSAAMAGTTASRISSGNVSESGTCFSSTAGTTRLAAPPFFPLSFGEDFGGTLDADEEDCAALGREGSDGFSFTDRLVGTTCPSVFFGSEGFFGVGMNGILQEATTCGKDVNRQIPLSLN